MTRLIGADVFWTFQPFLALIGAMLGLTMLWLLRRFGAPQVVAVVGAIVAAQPALLYALGQAGSLKEVGAALRVKVDCSLAGLASRRDGDAPKPRRPCSETSVFRRASPRCGRPPRTFMAVNVASVKPPRV